MVKVKICGITNLEDAIVSIDAGYDALGFVFYKKSPRYISPDKAKAIIQKLPKNIIKIGVFVNQRESMIKAVAKLCSLNMLQFHGSESPSFCLKFKKYKVVKAFKVRNKIDFGDVLKYNTFAYLFDKFKHNKLGGTGRQFDWKLLKDMPRINKPFFLSGGLNINNVEGAVKQVKPDWVDVSSSLEIQPGKKSKLKIKRFISRIK